MAIDFVFAPPTNNTGFIGMISYINNLTDVGQGGMFFTVMLIVLAGILFMMMRAYSPERAFGITSIIIGIIAWLFRILDWVNDEVITIITILMIFGVYLLMKEAEAFET